MSEMIERVAKALDRANDSHPEDGIPYKAMACAAIEAMREPTDAMLKAMWRRNDDNDSERATLENWQEAIDEALK